MTPLQEIQIDRLQKKMELEYDFEIVPVQIETFSTPKQCYSNVEKKVKQDGGKIHYGWSVHFNEGIIVEAERHAVWENDDEDLICITPHPSDYKEVIFLSDNTAVDPKLQIDNIRMNITNNPLVEDWIYLANMVGHLFYKYTDRIDNEQVNIETPVLKVIKQLEEWRNLVMGLIKLGKKERSNCYCEKGSYDKRKYLECHSKFFKKEIPVLLESIHQFAKR
ncbi:MAG: hypothetical protein V4670_08410 [Bacteroidota bacterium]